MDLYFKAIELDWIRHYTLFSIGLDIRHLVLHLDWMLILFPWIYLGLSIGFGFIIHYHIRLPFDFGFCASGAAHG
jgi:hypothetical protein